jgi:hypothetical protein
LGYDEEQDLYNPDRIDRARAGPVQLPPIVRCKDRIRVPVLDSVPLPGQWVQYFSTTMFLQRNLGLMPNLGLKNWDESWVDARVLSHSNIEDGTYDLDIKPAVHPAYLRSSPHQGFSESSFPAHKPGDAVEYLSSAKTWIPATLLRYDVKRGTYTLTCEMGERNLVSPIRVRTPVKARVEGRKERDVLNQNRPLSPRESPAQPAATGRLPLHTVPEGSESGGADDVEMEPYCG